MTSDARRVLRRLSIAALMLLTPLLAHSAETGCAFPRSCLEAFASVTEPAGLGTFTRPSAGSDVATAGGFSQELREGYESVMLSRALPNVALGKDRVVQRRLTAEVSHQGCGPVRELELIETSRVLKKSTFWNDSLEDRQGTWLVTGRLTLTFTGSHCRISKTRYSATLLTPWSCGGYAMRPCTWEGSNGIRDLADEQICVTNSRPDGTLALKPDDVRRLGMVVRTLLTDKPALKDRAR